MSHDPSENTEPAGKYVFACEALELSPLYPGPPSLWYRIGCPDCMRKAELDLLAAGNAPVMNSRTERMETLSTMVERYGDPASGGQVVSTPIRAGRAARAEHTAVLARVREMGDLHESVLEARGLGRGMVAAPPRRRQQTLRAGGGWVDTGAQDYDWFYSLSKKEQRRLYDDWFTHEKNPDTGTMRGVGIDELSEKMSPREWVDHTRGADLARVIGAGKTANPDRYGGLTGESLRRDAGEHPASEAHRRTQEHRRRYSRETVDYGDDEAF